jgi:hypothetical protein
MPLSELTVEAVFDRFVGTDIADGRPACSSLGSERNLPED